MGPSCVCFVNWFLQKILNIYIIFEAPKDLYKFYSKNLIKLYYFIWFSKFDVFGIFLLSNMYFRNKKWEYFCTVWLLIYDIYRQYMSLLTGVYSIFIRYFYSLGENIIIWLIWINLKLCELIIKITLYAYRTCIIVIIWLYWIHTCEKEHTTFVYKFH